MRQYLESTDTDDIIDRVADYINKNEMIGQKDSVFLGVSGGADSVCLLLVMSKLAKKLGFTLKVISVEHGIRGEESRQDAAFVEKLCIEKDIPCRVIPVDAPAYAKENKMTLEEAARKLRYEAFFSVAKEGDIIASAHHANDNAETFLFNLIRGSDLRGLSGISPVSDMKGRKLIRPLLCLERSEIEAYLEKEGQEYRTDSTNVSLEHDRNRIRLAVMPEFSRINSKAVSHINDAIAAIKRSCDAGERRSKEIVAEAKGSKGLDTERLMLLPKGDRGSVIMTWLRGELSSVKDIGRVHVEAIENLAEGASGRGVDIPGGVRVEKTYHELVIKTAGAYDTKSYREFVIPPLDEEEVYQLSLEGYDINITLHGITWAEGKEIPQKTYYKWFDYDKIKGGLTLRRRKKGDRIVVTESGCHKSIKDLFKDEKIDRDLRDEILLLADESEIVWAIGVRGSEGYRIGRETKRILEINILRS
ncbi:MAG: tRNA lysidine(34) synthetase TilS [Lachnospiraceae bacterium]|nr:tRNA lysidine(34) synthetase TilS [Lachnospiraceae bacterium]